MESKKLKITTKCQLEKLVELMEKYPQTARGKLQDGWSRSKIKELWEEFAIELNSLGPPSRNAREWSRVWIHYKANLKRKLANIRSNYITTGGDPMHEVPLNQLEESVAQLIQISEQVEPSDHAIVEENTPSEMDDEEIESITSVASFSTADQSLLYDRPTSSASLVAESPRSVNQHLETERLELLKVQVQTHKEVLQKLDQIEKSLYKNYEVNKKLLELKQRKFNLYKREARDTHELHALKAANINTITTGSSCIS